MVPPTEMLSASMSVVNHNGSGGSGAQDLAREPAREEDGQERDIPADAGSHAAEDERAHRGQDAPDAHARGGDETAERDHRQVRREQDIEELDVQEQREVTRSSEDRDRSDRDGEVHVREHTRRRSEGDVEAAPQERDRQDQHRHEHEERFPLGSPRRPGCRRRCGPDA